MKNQMKVQMKVMMIGLSASLLLFAGCNNPTTGTNTWSIEGVDGPHLTYSVNTLSIDATFSNITVNAGATIPIPNMPNSSIEVAPDVQTGALLLAVTIDTTDVAALIGSNLINPQTLPGGRPLPGVAAGSLPAIAVQVPALDNMTFYIGPQVFGLFAPVNFSLNQVIGTFSFYDNSGNRMGDLSVVGQDVNKANSGFLLLINIPAAATVMSRDGYLKM